MRSIEIARQTKVSAMMVTLLRQGKTKTTNIPLAVAMAEMTGKRPIDFISDKIRSLALQINPGLAKRLKRTAP